MALTTEKLDLPYPELDDPADAPHDIRELAEKVDETVPAMLQGPFAGLPPAGTQGRFYFASDRGTLLFDDGANWQPVSAAIGDLKLSSRAAEHQGWIIANGRALSAGQYPQLRAILIADGSKFGVVSGNPKLPDMGGRVPVGAGPGYVHGASGGVAAQALSAANLPSHAHSVPAQGIYSHVTGGVSNGALSDLWAGGNGWALNGIGVLFTANPNKWSAHVGTTQAGTTGGAGSSTAHNNMQPYTVGQWFIYAGPAA